jgi:hypothetical protein
VAATFVCAVDVVDKDDKLLLAPLIPYWNTVKRSPPPHVSFALP